MWRLAEQQLDEFVADGRCEFITAYAQPFAMLVVADLLGVPETDHQRFREGFGLTKGIGTIGAGAKGSVGENPLGGRTSGSRRTSRIADPTPDGRAHRSRACDLPRRRHTPVTSVVRTATFLFAAGQETTARLLAAALKHLAEHPELQTSCARTRTASPASSRRFCASRAR